MYEYSNCFMRVILYRRSIIFMFSCVFLRIGFSLIIFIIIRWFFASRFQMLLPVFILQPYCMLFLLPPHLLLSASSSHSALAYAHPLATPPSPPHPPHRVCASFLIPPQLTLILPPYLPLCLILLATFPPLPPFPLCSSSLSQSTFQKW
jgi:hypothetical protein